MSGTRRPSPKLDQFAALLVDGLTPSEAAIHMGVTKRRGHRYLEYIRKRLGPQAV